MLNRTALAALSASDPSRDYADDILNIYPKVREIVAAALISPAHGVTFGPEEVTIVTDDVYTEVDRVDGTPPTGAMERLVQITVQANRYDWRVPIKDPIAERIGREIGKLLPPGVTYWVWLQLPEAGFYAGETPVE